MAELNQVHCDGTGWLSPQQAIAAGVTHPGRCPGCYFCMRNANSAAAREATPPALGVTFPEDFDKFIPMAVPAPPAGERLSLHRCKVCGTRWLLWPDAVHGGGWNLLDCWQRPGACCDNAPMGEQIEHLRDIPLTVPVPNPHRCSGCGHRWEGPLKGAELCGDCWRKAQPVLHAPAGETATELVTYYGCVACQSYHYEGDPLYREHLWRQSKHGLQRGPRPPAPCEHQQAEEPARERIAELERRIRPRREYCTANGESYCRDSQLPEDRSCDACNRRRWADELKDILRAAEGGK